MNLADLPLGEVIVSVASEDISPGAGAAGAVALALAAACAGKAVAITLKRRPDDELVRARERLAGIARRAMRGAEVDATRFEDFVRTKDAETADRLIDAGEWLRRLAVDLEDALRGIEDRIDPVVASDVAAARALGSAFVAIQSRNLDENRSAADDVV